MYSSSRRTPTDYYFGKKHYTLIPTRSGEEFELYYEGIYEGNFDTARAAKEYGYMLIKRDIAPLDIF